MGPANATDRLGALPVFSKMCIGTVPDMFWLCGIDTDAIVFCGLGPKIMVSTIAQAGILRWR